ncbi:MAG: NAD(P)-dependent oxidoreductase [Proteobacteria bacterium]|nr:NAD(P)-dependent oxidoreductase [Pseudomonadota bacterium]
MGRKKRIFITGATGSMGSAGLKELVKHRDTFDITCLVRPSKVNKKKMLPYYGERGIRIIFGNMLNYEDVLDCVNDADYILHTAAVIPPMADHDPDFAYRVNVGGTANIIKAVKAQPDPDKVKLLYVGSVAQTGDRLPPLHVGRIGDPISPGPFDAYGLSKIGAEKLVIESGLKHWVSFRQTYITIPDAMSLMDGIMYHQPIQTCIEFCPPKNAGVLLEKLCLDGLPEDFWCRIYNIGGGPSCRLIYSDYMQRMMELLGMGDFTRIMDRNWFALRNFHCQWYEDSHVLNSYLPFWVETAEDYFRQVKECAPWYVKMAGLPIIRNMIPMPLVKSLVMGRMAGRKGDGTMYWIKNNVTDRINAFFRSRKDWENIPPWGVDMPATPTVDTYVRLNHGYDENKPKSELDIENMREAAAFRGGECLSPAMTKGDLTTRLKWRCAFGHEFEASPTLILLGGYWCPECEAPPWNNDEIAARNPFFAQVWYNTHSKDEKNVFPADCVYDCVGKDKEKIIFKRKKKAGQSFSAGLFDE